MRFCPSRLTHSNMPVPAPLSDDLGWCQTRTITLDGDTGPWLARRLTGLRKEVRAKEVETRADAAMVSVGNVSQPGATATCLYSRRLASLQPKSNG
jgi:hypothetical protein